MAMNERDHPALEILADQEDSAPEEAKPKYRVTSKRPPTEAALPTLWFHCTIARSAVKVAADNLKAFGNAIYLYVPRIFIRCRNPSCAGLSAMRASKVLNPAVAGHP